MSYITRFWSGPIRLGGDFNLSRFFNDWINRWCLLEAQPSNRSCTWANNEENRIMARLDRIFVSTDFDRTSPLAMMQALCEEGSGHVPLVVNLRDNTASTKKQFRFEKWWLEREDFKDIVIKTRNLQCSDRNPVDIQQFRIKMIRKNVRGWAANVVVAMNRTKKELSDEYNILDIQFETRQLTQVEFHKMKHFKIELEKLRALEEIKGRYRSQDRDILEGDRNITYFQVVANQRNRNKRIHYQNNGLQ